MTNTQNAVIAAGQTLTARSACDYECIFSVRVVGRTGSFAIIEGRNKIKRVKIHQSEDGEYIYALGRYSMAPTFWASEAQTTDQMGGR